MSGGDPSLAVGPHAGPVPAGSRQRGELRPVPASGISPVAAGPQAKKKPRRA